MELLRKRWILLEEYSAHWAERKTELRAPGHQVQGQFLDHQFPGHHLVTMSLGQFPLGQEVELAETVKVGGDLLPALAKQLSRREQEW